MPIATPSRYEPSSSLPGQYKGLLGATLDRVERFAEAVAADPKHEKRARLAAGALYHAATAALLAWKEPISGFVHVLSVKELRAAILLAVLTCVILPALPAEPVDPWGLVEPRSNWASVVLIAGIGFVNYILLRLLGPGGWRSPPSSAAW